MDNTKNTVISVRHWLKLAEVILSLILLGLKIFAVPSVPAFDLSGT